MTEVGGPYRDEIDLDQADQLPPGDPNLAAGEVDAEDPEQLMGAVIEGDDGDDSVHLDAAIAAAAPDGEPDDTPGRG